MKIPTISSLKTQLAELVALPAIAGEEAAVATWISRQLERAGLEPAVDSLGNVILASTVPPRVLVTAHMDQVGYMVSRLEADHARCLAVGDPQPGAGGERVLITSGCGERTAAGTIHGREDEGAILRSDELDSLRVGDSAVFAGRLRSGKGALVSAPALDDRLGCLAVLHVALAAQPAADVAFAWTVREETEQAGIMRVACDLGPAAVVAVDVTPVTGDEGFDSIVVCGSGPVITLMDEGTVADPGLLRAFSAAAARLNLGWQPEIVASGLSEAGQVQRALGIPALALLVAIEDPHSSAETADLTDLAALIDLLGGVLERKD